MENIHSTYFDILPKELIEVIIEVIVSIDSLENFERLSYSIYKLMNNKNMWDRIASKLNVYQSIRDEIGTRMDLKPENLRDIIIGINSFYRSEGEFEDLIIDDWLLNIIRDIISRDKIREKYPQLYEHIKSYNLYSIGSVELYYKYDRSREWYNLYSRIQHIHSMDGFPDNMINFIKTGKLPYGYIYDEEPIYSYGKQLFYIIYAIILASNINIQPNLVLLDLLQTSFYNNFELYELLFTKIPKTKLIEIFTDKVVLQYIKETLENINFHIQEDNYWEIITKSFYSDFFDKMNSLG